MFKFCNSPSQVKWIEEHQSNPYPTKAEKQYLGYYSGMNLTQLSTWFANARRRIKKIGMKIWLEGRSTFTVDLFSTPSQSARTVSMASSDSGYHGSVSGKRITVVCISWEHAVLKLSVLHVEEQTINVSVHVNMILMALFFMF